ncbi:MAG: phosphoribosylformylglycinamidine synthase subunit PurS [Novibacillus thermophilus]
MDVPNRAQAEEQVVAMCERLLANPVIETYTVSVEEADA